MGSAKVRAQRVEPRPRVAATASRRSQVGDGPSTSTTSSRAAGGPQVGRDVGRHIEGRQGRRKRPGRPGLLALLGMSLHNVQDSMPQPNWVDGGNLGPPGRASGKYGDHPTWALHGPQDAGSLEVYTSLNRPSNAAVSRGLDSDSLALNNGLGRPPALQRRLHVRLFATGKWVRLFRDVPGQARTWNQMPSQWRRNPSTPPGIGLRAKDLLLRRTLATDGEAPSGAGASKYFLAGAVVDFLHGLCVKAANASPLRQRVETLLLGWEDARNHGPFDVTLPSASPRVSSSSQLKVHSVFATQGDDGFLGGTDGLVQPRGIDGPVLVRSHRRARPIRLPFRALRPWTMTKAVPYSRRYRRTFS